MKGRPLARGIAICTALAVAGCATAPPQELSILDAMNARPTLSGRPMSCAALDAATMCVQSSRLDRTKDCGCVDRQSITDGRAFSF